MWVLVFTIMHVQTGVATSSVEGFTSRESCLEAAKEVSSNANKSLDVTLFRQVHISTSCVSQQLIKN